MSKMPKCKKCGFDNSWPDGLLVLRINNSGQQEWSWYAGGEEEADGEKEIYDKDKYHEIMRLWVSGSPDFDGKLWPRDQAQQAGKE